jgi:hypothetical protein
MGLCAPLVRRFMQDRRDSGAIAQAEQSSALPECQLIVLVKLKLELIRRSNYRESDCRSRGNVHADRYVFPVFLAIGNVGGRVNFEFALYGRVLIDVEGH